VQWGNILAMAGEETTPRASIETPKTPATSDNRVGSPLEEEADNLINDIWETLKEPLPGS